MRKLFVFHQFTRFSQNPTKRFVLKMSSSSSSATSSADDGPICFYDHNAPYGDFANFSEHPIFLEGKWWPTTEHFFQAKKFEGTPHEEDVRTCGYDPGMAKALGLQRNRPLRKDWETVKEKVMFDALVAKFSQHPSARALLMGTGDRPLVEHTPKDKYWGDGGDGTGLNRLGFQLQQVRDHLRNNPNAIDPSVTQSPTLPAGWKTIGATSASS